MTKHNLGVDLENLDFEAKDKEMEADEAAEGLRLLPQLLKAIHPRPRMRPLSPWLETIPQLHELFFFFQCLTCFWAFILKHLLVLWACFKKYLC